MSAHIATHETHEGLLTKLHLGEALGSGVIAGLGFALISMVYYSIAGQGMWAPLRLMSTLLMGTAAFGVTFAIAPVVVGFLLNLFASAGHGFLYTEVVGAYRSMPVHLLLGVVYGIALYLINLLLLGPTIWPLFLAANQIFWAVNHIAFGLILGYTLHQMMLHKERAGM